MAMSGSATISTKSFYGSGARAQPERQHGQLIEPDFGDSDKEVILMKMKYQTFLMKKVIIQVKMKVVMIDMTMKLIWLLMMTVRILRQKFQLLKDPKLEILPKI